ncbi:MAG: hypothetical protein ACR2NX_02505, partial [Chthoniobacterales bacterium]
FALASPAFPPIRQVDTPFSGCYLIRKLPPPLEHETGGYQLNDGWALLFFASETHDIPHIGFRNIDRYFHKLIIPLYEKNSKLYDNVSIIVGLWHQLGGGECVT